MVRGKSRANLRLTRCNTLMSVSKEGLKMQSLIHRGNEGGTGKWIALKLMIYLGRRQTKTVSFGNEENENGKIELKLST